MKQWNINQSVCILQSNIPNKGRGPIGNQEEAASILRCVPYYGKDHEGNNKDTIHIINCLKLEGWNGKVVKFQIDKLDQIFNYIKDNFCAYICRINPGQYPQHENELNDFLRKLSLNGLKGLLHPDSIQNYGNKKVLYKLKSTELVGQDIHLYQNIDLLKKRLPINMIAGPRILKRNKGSYGDGVWKVEIYNIQNNLQLMNNMKQLPLDTLIRVTYAFNNMIKIITLAEFFEFCEQTMLKQNDYFIDVKFLPLISEGEIKLTLVNDQPMFVLHKIPNGLSTNKISGSLHTYYPICQWQQFCDFFISKLSLLKEILNEKDLPLLWTADFILESRENGVDKYVLSQINCTCIGFSEQINYGIQQTMAKEIIRRCSL